MTSEVLGYVNMAIGVVGIVLTVLSAPTLLHLGTNVGTEALPPELTGIGGIIRTVAVLLILVVFVFLLALGMALTIATVTTAMGAALPMLTAVLIVAALFSVAATAALAAYRHALWVPGVIGSLSLATLASVAALSTNPTALPLTFCIALAVFLGTGALTLLAMGQF